MKKRTVIRIASFSSAVLLLFAGIAVKEKKTAANYRLEIQNNYSRAYNELDSRMNNIRIILDKMIYLTGSQKMTSLSAQLYGEAQLAKNSISMLPLENSEESTVFRFLSQVGNYALSVSKDAVKNGDITDKQESDLKKLSETAKTISMVLSDNQSSINGLKYWSGEIEKKLTQKDGTLADTLTELEENLTDYPTLIYDGPYSDHILNKKPLMTSGKPEISQEQAGEIAAEFSGDREMKFSSLTESKIPAYNFTGNTDISVSKEGGYVVFMRKNRNVTSSSLTPEKAVQTAENFLKEKEIPSMVSTYYYCEENICTVNFAYLDGRTLCYTDLIKVGVALDNAEIIEYEASGYLTNHTERAFSAPENTVEAAAQKVSDRLEIVKHRIVLIPTGGGSEIRCYEFTCRGQNNEEMLVFVGLSSLEVEEILILLKNDGGTLIK